MKVKHRPIVIVPIRLGMQICFHDEMDCPIGREERTLIVPVGDTDYCTVIQVIPCSKCNAEEEKRAVRMIKRYAKDKERK